MKFVTVSVLGTKRSSSASSCGRKRGAVGRCCARPRGDRIDARFCSQEKNDMMFSPFENWLSFLSRWSPLLQWDHLGAEGYVAQACGREGQRDAHAAACLDRLT